MKFCHGTSGNCLGLKVRHRQIMGMLWNIPGYGGSIGSGLCRPEGDTSSSILLAQGSCGCCEAGDKLGTLSSGGGGLVSDSGALTALPPPRKTRAELMKDIDAEYYGYRDEDDGILEPLEQEHEKKGM